VAGTNESTTQTKTEKTGSFVTKSSSASLPESKNPATTSAAFTEDELSHTIDLVLSISDEPFNKTDFELFMSKTISANVTVTSYTDKLSKPGGVAKLTVVMFLRDKDGSLMSQSAAINTVNQKKAVVTAKYGNFEVRVHELTGKGQTQSGGGGVSAGLVAGVVVGTLVIVTLVVIGILKYRSYRKKGKYGVM
jgi:hypothetical protein